jgi:deferrochelatase/peroxidase EfeB
MIRPDRRAFLRGALATGIAGTVAGIPSAEAAPVVPVFGPHQPGIASNPRRRTVMASFDVTAQDKAELADLFAALTARVRALSAGGPPAESGITAPSPDSGLLGPAAPGGGLLCTLGVGASLFDDRFGLASRKPTHLTPMQTFANDALRPAWCHGDLSVQLSADDDDVLLHALRDVARHTRGGMQLRWRINGFTSPPRPSGTQRNLMGFKDGIANPAPADFDRLVWAAAGDQPWTRGGSYQVVRLIRMLVEFWDRVSRDEQERMFGRSKDTGAPLDGGKETDVPNYPADPEGKVIPLDSHIRLANPRNAQTEAGRILRRGFNYDRGVDEAGDLDMGLIFICYQQEPRRQFEAVQLRLKDEPLVDYISPFGGGYFFALPGLRDPSAGFGQGLLS